MSTFADVKKAAGRKKPFIFNNNLPAGHFGATITLEDNITVYLLEGAEHDKNSRIKGRVVLVPSEDGSGPGTLKVYKGDNLRDGGEFLGCGSTGHRFDENFLRIL